jgi:hypothetical protein
MKNYQAPKVIKKIALDSNDAIIKASNGLNVSELESEGLIGQEDAEMMMQWGMEAFTNPEVIKNSLEYIETNAMFSNEFLNDFKLMNVDILKKLSLLPMISNGLNFKTNGIAIQRANTYTYKNNDYLLATAQSYHPGEFGDQQHIWTATLSNDVSIFTTHPAMPLSDDGALSGSPNYWVGSGRLPHSVQEENINLSIYVIPNKKGFLEETLIDFTHAYFPKQLMDNVIIDGNYIYGRLGNCYIAMIGMNDLYYADNSTDDLIQMGKTTYWVTELSTNDAETFEEFIERIQSNDIYFNSKDNQLNYTSNGKEHSLTYNKEFRVNGALINTEYGRMDSPYASVERKDDSITIEYKDKALILDFYNLKRVEY